MHRPIQPMLPTLLALAPLFAGGCAPTRHAPASPAARGVPDAGETLDRFHRAAAEADGETYFSLLHQDAIFLGTDASERWTKDAFRAWVDEGGYFEDAPGWVYTPIRRNVTFGAADGGAGGAGYAWFDELLRHERYGELRGSGVLVRTPSGWRIGQYNLHFVVPNEVAPRVVEVIGSAGASGG